MKPLKLAPGARAFEAEDDLAKRLRDIRERHGKTEQERSAKAALRNVPKRYQGIDLSECQAPEEILGWTPTDSHWCLGILGPLEAGKTYLATAIWARLVSELGNGLWKDAQDVITEARMAISSGTESEILPPLCSTPMLLLDDLGRQRNTEYSHEILTHAIRSRYNNRAPIIWTSNLGLDELQKWDDAVASRITGNDTVIWIMPDAKWRSKT